MPEKEPQSKLFPFKRTERLKSRKVIDSLFILNQHIKIYPLKIVWKMNPVQEAFSAQIGFAVSKKNFKLAVTRNLIKRRIRESYRLNKPLLYRSTEQIHQELFIMIIYVGKEIVPYRELDQKIKQLLIRLNQLVISRAE